MAIRVRSLPILMVVALLATAGCNREGVTELMQAAKQGDVAAVERQIAEGVDVNQRSDYGWTALMFACREGHKDAAERLLAAGANPNLVSDRIAVATTAPYPASSALREAIDNGHVDIATLLLDVGASIDHEAIVLAGKLGDIAVLEQLDALGAEFNTQSQLSYYPSPLVMAAGEGHVETIRWLLEHGADPNLMPHGSTALIMAVYKDQAEVVATLLENGADPNLVVGRSEVTAFLRAATKHTGYQTADANLRILRMLIHYGADPDHRSQAPEYKGRTAAEVLEDKRIGSLERIEANRYGEAQQDAERALLEHRDKILALIDSVGPVSG